MNQKIIPFRAGITNCHLLVNDGRCLLVDTGSKNNAHKILKKIQAIGLKNESLTHVFLTHTHFDHSGSVAEIIKETGAKVIVHESEAANLKEGFTRIPKGTNAFFRFISNAGRNGPMERKIGGYDPVEPELTFDHSLHLDSIGFEGKIIHTPGHTKGSSTLLVENMAVVGDTMFNLSGDYYPGFANDEELLLETWKKLTTFDVKWYWPSHGKRIEKAKLLKFIERKKIFG